ncbi:hypothetical protein QBC47DRAFT_370853 [Echria macrotheca]|uniref:2EXR domain-containing protein n=1 Tax=Echria macrotheca TaxID=438768 RepID=A0AAJ0BJ99_9PEZI|nr:hypothetical protein QBC47DRAFT_370853 [Echria macrotheca]
MAGSEFHLFPRLPSEIQLMIWECASAVERIVPILPGLGHLSPITHQTLRVPPILHACANSRQVGLKYYNLSFHPRLYINRDYDHLMLHIFFPDSIIDSNLYDQPEAEFNWKAAPPRLAVFLDDISFYQSEYEIPSRGSSHPRDPTCGPSFHPFSWDFMRSIARYFDYTDPTTLTQLTLLVLPPLTARPNPMAHRLDFASGPVFEDMTSFHAAEFRARKNRDEPELPPLVLRHAAVSPFPTPFPTPSQPPAYYASLKYGFEPTPRDIDNTPHVWWAGGYALSSPTDVLTRQYRLSDDQKRFEAIQNDINLVSHPFSHGNHVGLGPHVVWDHQPHYCGNGAVAARRVYHYQGIPRLLWADRGKEKRPVKGRESWSSSDDEREEQDPAGPRWNTLRFNGLFFWRIGRLAKTPKGWESPESSESTESPLMY